MVTKNFGPIWDTCSKKVWLTLKFHPKQKRTSFSLFRCYTTTSPTEYRSLADIQEDMVEGQEHIWYITDINKDLIASRPILEGFTKRNYEVMLLSDPVDEWVVMQNSKYGEIELKSVVSEELPEDEAQEETEEERADKDQSETLVGWLGVCWIMMSQKFEYPSDSLLPHLCWFLKKEQ